MPTLVVYSATSDGIIVSNGGASYANARAGSGTLTPVAAAAAHNIGQQLSAGTYFVYEGFLSFDTSTIGSSIVTAAELALYGNASFTALAGGDFTLEARAHAWAAGGLTTGDWVAGANLSGKTLLASIATTSWNTAAYNVLTNDAAFEGAINGSGTTDILLNSSKHRLNTAPTGNELAGMHFADETGTTKDPKLTITYGSPPFVSSPLIVSYAFGTSTHQYATPFEVAFTASDTDTQAADALNWQIRTGANRTGTLVASGTCTHAVPETASIAYNASGLVDGSQTLYLSVDDGVAASSDASFSVLRRIGIRKDVTLQWRQGGRVTKTIELQWRQGGRISREWALQWRVAPSDARIARALVTSPVVRSFRFERRDMNNQFLADVTPAIVSASGDLNNDRAIRRTARFTIDPTAATIDPLSDHIAVFEDLLVDGSYWQEFQWGLFALTAPQYRHTPALTTWEVGGNDLSIHLMEATTTETYVVSAGTNYMAAVASILDAHGIRHALPSSSATLPADKIFEVGTPWLTVINELLKAINYLTLYIDRYGVATTRYSDSLATRTPDVTYSGANLMVLDELAQEDDLTRFANQIIAVVTDANRAPLSSVATNADPNSPISTVRLGRTITKRIESSAVDQATLDAQVQRALEDAASMYQRMEVLTPLDPRREAHEVYAIDVDGLYEDSTWWARNWSVDFRPGATMKHALGRVQRIAS